MNYSMWKFKFGYIDKTGSFVIPPRFDKFCDNFSEGLADVMVDDKFGFIDRNGDFVIPPQYEWVLPFAHGIAAVSIEGKCGYIDKSGTIVIPPIFEKVDEFSDGLAYAKTATQAGYIDPTGAWALIPPADYEGYPFCDGLAIVCICEEDELNEDECVEECNCACEGYIDKTGAIAIPPQFKEVDDFSEGLAHVETEDGEHVFIDTKGDVALKFDFDCDVLWDHSFSEGLVAVRIDGKFGYADKTGRIVIAPQFDEVYQFTEGLAGVRTGSWWGFIDKTGEWVIEPKPWHPYNFFEGLAAVGVRDYNMKKIYPQSKA